MADAPELVLVGHVAKDLMPDGTTRFGGTVTYAALLAQRLGVQVGIVTSMPDLDLPAYGQLVAPAQVHTLPAPVATTFENRYHAGQRTQWLHARATTLDCDAVPMEWRGAPLVLLGPIADEIVPEVAAVFVGKLRGATPQGWLRRWDDGGRVSQSPWQSAARILPHLDVLILSEEDLAIAAANADGQELIAGWAAQVPIVVVTAGPRAATLWIDGKVRQRIPAFVVPEVDPTGAGDCFAVALLIALWRGDLPEDAVRFAHAAASFVIQSPGIEGIPSAGQIDTLLT